MKSSLYRQNEEGINTYTETKQKPYYDFLIPIGLTEQLLVMGPQLLTMDQDNLVVFGIAKNSSLIAMAHEIFHKVTP